MELFACAKISRDLSDMPVKWRGFLVPIDLGRFEIICVKIDVVYSISHPLFPLKSITIFKASQIRFVSSREIFFSKLGILAFFSLPVKNNPEYSRHVSDTHFESEVGAFKMDSL